MIEGQGRPVPSFQSFNLIRLAAGSTLPTGRRPLPMVTQTRRGRTLAPFTRFGRVFIRVAASPPLYPRDASVRRVAVRNTTVDGMR